MKKYILFSGILLSFVFLRAQGPGWDSTYRPAGYGLKVGLIDLHPHFLDGQGRLDPTCTEDGLHLNAKGYAVWKGVLLDYLK